MHRFLQEFTVLKGIKVFTSVHFGDRMGAKFV